MAFRRSHELTIDELREILRLPNHLIAIIKPDGTFYKVNEESNPVLGWEPDEVIGQKVRDYVHPEDWEETYAHMTSVFLGVKSVVEDMRNRIRRKDGSWRWISWTGKAKGGYIYAHGSDVTEKIEYEEALTVQSLVLESISEGVIICNDKGIIVFANTAAEKLYGYEVEELPGQKIYVLSGKDEETSREKIREVLKEINEDQVWKGEFENIKKDGTHFSSSCRVTILDLHGERHYVCVQRDISKKKRLTREREELETRFRTFFEQSPLGMIIFDMDGRPLEINRAWEEIFQVSREAFKDFRLFKDPFAISMGHIPYIERAIAGEVVMIPPFFIDPQPTGTVPGARSRWLEVWFSPIKGPDGKTRELACILKDITTEVSTRRSLEDLESKYRIASESLSLAVKVGKVGIWEWIPKDDLIIWDETTLEIFGYPKGSSPLKAEAVISHFHPDDRDHCMDMISESLKSAKPYSMDYRIRRKDGVVRWVQGAGMPFYDSQGDVHRVLGTVIDITERKEQEEDQKFISDIAEILSSSFDYTANIQKVAELTVVKYFDNMTVYELLKDHRARPIAAANNNPAKLLIMKEIQNSDVELSAPKSGLVRALEEHKELFFPDFLSCLPSYDYRPEHVALISKLDVKSVFMINLQGKEGLAGFAAFHVREGKVIDERRKKIIREIAYRMTLALENSVLYHQSQEAIRARDEFLSIASHELKTPLQSLTLQNEIRKRMISKGAPGAFEKSDMERALNMDHRQLTRINRLIDDMLDISRIRNARLSIQKENFNLITLLNDVCERMKPQFEAASCSFAADYSGEIIVSADSYRIEQVMMNLLINAMKYSAGTSITVRARKLAGKAVIEVEDKGPGIGDEDLERIFNRFERAVKGHDVTGMGLGLYIAREIMELHQGRVYAKSKLGHGSTFILELPL